MTSAEPRQSGALAAEALELLETWERLASAHKIIGGSCSCGAHGMVLRLTDFEQDIGDYLRDEAERHQRRDVLELLRKSAVVGGDWDMVRFLEKLSVSGEHLDTAAARFVLDRLPRTVRSFEELHRRR